jgi:hypothetical protein
MPTKLSTAQILSGLALTLFTCSFLVMCNAVETIKDGRVDLGLDDSLTVEAGKYDSLAIDILNADGSIRIANAFKGPFKRSNSGEIKDIHLGDNPPANYKIQVRAYKQGILISISEVTITGKLVSDLKSIALPSIALDSLVFDPAILALEVGQTSLPMVPKAKPTNASDKVSLSSGDDAKAVIQSGNAIKAVAEGTVTITATSLLFPKKQAFLTVVIGPSTLLKATPKTVLISKRSLTLTPTSKPEELFAYFLPDTADQRVIWTSTDASIASIVNGIVTPGSTGKVWIKAQAYSDVSVADSIPVSVVIPTAFDSVRISKLITRFFVNGAGQKINFKTYPEDKPAQLNWTSQDEGVMKVDADGSIAALSSGTVWIVATAMGNPDIRDSILVTVVRDIPKLNAGTSQNVVIGQKATFNIVVEQEFGGIKSLQWDLDGDGKWDGTTTEASAKAEITYPSIKKEYQAVFKVTDGESNMDSITVRVRVGFDTPLIVITSPSHDTSVNSPNFTVYYTVDGTPKTKTFTLPVDSTYRLLISETKATGTDSQIVIVTMDTKPPVVEIISPTATFITNKSTVKVEWKVDNIVQNQKTDEDISSKEGEISITRDFTDIAGNKGQGRVTIIRDVTKPKIEFVSPKNGDIVTNSTIPVNWMVDNIIQTTQITQALTGADGDKFITRKATDAAGNTDSLTIKVTLDGSQPGKPVLTLDAISPTKVNTPTWSWVSGGNGTGNYQYKLDANDFTGVVSTKVLAFKTTALPDGLHTLYVREQDPQGAWGPVGSLPIEIDTKSPTVVITAPTAGTKFSTATAIPVTWTVDDIPKSNTETLTGADGEKTITRSGTDAAGNSTTVTQKVILDLLKPVAPTMNATGTTASPASGAAVTWKWTSGNAANGNGKYRYRMDNSDLTAVSTAVAVPEAIISGLTEGLRTLYVEEGDDQGNWSPFSSHGITIDKSGPIITPDNGGTTVYNSTFTVTASVSDAPAGVKSVTLSKGATNVGAMSINASTGKYALAVTLSVGANVYTITATDNLNNTRTGNVTITLGQGTVTITGPVDNYVTGTNFTISYNLSVNGKITAKTQLIDLSDNTKYSSGKNTVTVNEPNAVSDNMTVYYLPNVVFVRKGATGSTSDGSSWDNAYHELRDAIESIRGIKAGNEIWVSAGTYEGSAQLGNFSMAAGVKMYGGFSAAVNTMPNSNSESGRSFSANRTILKPNPMTSSGVYVFRMNNSQSISSVLDGFVLDLRVIGYAVQIESSQILLMRNCTIESPDGEGIDGAIRVRGGAKVTMEKCTISNTQGPAYLFTVSGATLNMTDVTVLDNVAGTAFWVYANGSVTISNSTIRRNGPEMGILADLNVEAGSSITTTNVSTDYTNLDQHP